MDLKEKIENQLDDAITQSIILGSDIENMQNGLIDKQCFKPICSIKTLKDVESAYNTLIIALACALKEIRDKEKAK